MERRSGGVRTVIPVGELSERYAIQERAVVLECLDRQDTGRRNLAVERRYGCVKHIFDFRDAGDLGGEGLGADKETDIQGVVQLDGELDADGDGDTTLAFVGGIAENTDERAVRDWRSGHGWKAKGRGSINNGREEDLRVGIRANHEHPYK